MSRESVQERSETGHSGVMMIFFSVLAQHSNAMHSGWAFGHITLSVVGYNKPMERLIHIMATVRYPCTTT
jgi:hypothetical protein